MKRMEHSWWPTSGRQHHLNLAGDMFRGNKRRGFYLLCSYDGDLLAVDAGVGIECVHQPKGN